MSQESAGFYVAPFCIDGALEGFGWWEQSRLSTKWLALCDEFLNEHGDVSDAAWSASLSHIKTKMTSVSGAALISFSIAGKVAASILLASGIEPVAERELMTMFVDSLNQVSWVVVTESVRPFRRALELPERPLMMVVPWPDAGISERDQQLVRELGVHMAGAFFARAARGSTT